MEFQIQMRKFTEIIWNFSAWNICIYTDKEDYLAWRTKMLGKWNVPPKLHTCKNSSEMYKDANWILRQTPDSLVKAHTHAEYVYFKNIL